MSEDKSPKVEYSQEAGGLVSAVPLCADLEGKLVPCDSPEANTLVAGAGVPIEPKLAKKYGLSQARDQQEPRSGEHPTQLPAEEEKPTRRSLK